MPSFKLGYAFWTQNPGRVICHCTGIVAGELVQIVSTHRPHEVRELVAHTNAGKCCSACAAEIDDVIEHIVRRPAAAGAALEGERGN